MFIEFSISNFRSFKTLQTLSLEAANITSKYSEVDENNVIFTESKLKGLKSKAIYGANASGKSNLIKAILTFVLLVRFSVREEEMIGRLIKYFALSEENQNEPSFFQLIFTLKDEEGKERLYRYGFEIKANEVLTEWLFGAPKGVEKPFFVREGMNVRVNEGAFKEAKKFEDLSQKGDNEIFRNNSLFLSAVSAMGGKIARTITEYIGKIGVISALDDVRFEKLVGDKMKHPNEKQKILDLLKAADLGIEDVELLEEDEKSFPNELPDELKELFRQGKIQKQDKFLSKRNIYNLNNQKIGEITSDFEEWESEGTKKFFYLSPILIDTLREGRVLVIDEFDARLHPALTKKIVSLFNSKEINPNHAQLIFVTHDVSLQKMSLLRRDQICFVEKDKFGSSTISTLVEFKGVRNDSSFDKDYMQGKYGAVPLLNKMDNLFLKES
ncbi:MAG: ATP-binding protein [Thermoflexibacter sp.]|jgi:hypothetical protein|nr:ATP-binding protein [Thermoflexibacter sp.]